MLSLYSEILITDVYQVIDDIVTFTRIFKDDTLILMAARKTGVQGNDTDDDIQ